MFQTVGHQGVEYLGEAVGLPLYREATFGQSKMLEKNYCPTDNDEVEDLYRLLVKVKVGVVDFVQRFITHMQKFKFETMFLGAGKYRRSRLGRYSQRLSTHSRRKCVTIIIDKLK